MSHWYEQSFGDDYLIVYRHRDFRGAYEEVRRMTGWLDLPRGAKVLDLCCGMGRHSLSLVDFGYDVTGMDLSEVLLKEAVRNDTGSKVQWIRGDMRDVPLSGPYDGLVNLFTSFGYFSEDKENAKVLAEIGRLLRPGGRFVIDFLNAAYVINNLVPRSERQEGPIRIMESRSIEDGFVRKKIVLQEDGKPDRHYVEQVKLYRLPDFLRMFEEAGLVCDQVYGNYDGSDYLDDESLRLILVGHKQGRG